MTLIPQSKTIYGYEPEQLDYKVNEFYRRNPEIADAVIHHSTYAVDRGEHGTLFVYSLIARVDVEPIENDLEPEARDPEPVDDEPAIS